MANQKTLTVAGSPVVNTATGTATAKFDGDSNQTTVTALFTKVSGTLGGTATLQGSIDGTNYETIPTALVAGGASTYTVTDTAGTQAKSFVITGSPFKYYRISWAGTGTMNGTLAGFVRGIRY